MKYYLSLTVLLFCIGCQSVKSVLNEIEQDADVKTTHFQPTINNQSNTKTLLNDQWVEVWSDEFDGTTLNASKWTKTVSTKSRAARPDLGINSWFWVEDHAWLDGNGHLMLKSSKVTDDKMYCGSIDSENKFEPKYGFLEARIKIATTAKGNHTAFWLQGHNQGNVDGTANDGAEIDIFESAWLTETTKAVIHIDGYGSDHRANTKKYTTPNIHDGYHIYGLKWTADKLEIYYDGELKTTYEGVWVPQVKEWLWLSVGASFADGDFRSQPIGDLSVAEVDYVRVWEKNPNFNQPTTQDTIRLRNRGSNYYFRVKAEGDDAEVEQTNDFRQGDWTFWSLVQNNNFYHIKCEGTQKFIRAIDNTESANLYTKPLDNVGSWTQWEFIYVSEGYYLIKNKETGKYLRASSSEYDTPIVISAIADEFSQWKIERL
ncbi:family 16 glycosylhydrolase [Flammeovirga kamogawensis]|uniref:Family 16 glycosylhydrolase n=1 Tax=Flammeovirga kamogawensis TaxID=373891 RepID=A0ABX8H4A4_9BACT|nr:family 16 glycosylhydrolase [Flammeovirga kamogawensis]MBB6463163.1 beta-glucanase (GH16 family) [Flammeovirga kamogawensis]QWG10397.1 family 16 glycosylhydrolase [Flammeovirga kamogawensis]TRX63907.1 family 16 glycosylhydrolase [Flammeovirga kamogawensis]